MRSNIRPTIRGTGSMRVGEQGDDEAEGDKSTASTGMATGTARRGIASRVEVLEQVGRLERDNAALLQRLEAAQAESESLISGAGAIAPAPPPPPPPSSSKRDIDNAAAAGARDAGEGEAANLSSAAAGACFEERGGCHALGEELSRVKLEKEALAAELQEMKQAQEKLQQALALYPHLPYLNPPQPPHLAHLAHLNEAPASASANKKSKACSVM
jgi:hypothetical protein